MKTLTKLFSFTLISIFMLSTNVFSYASSEVKVLVNDKLINFPDAKPFINEDDRTLVPVRFIAENLGCEVEWKEEIRQVGIKGKDKQIKLNIGQSEALVDEEKITFDTKAIIKEDRTFVPLRFISEALGAKVEWDGESRTVFISTEDKEEKNDNDKEEKVSDDIKNTKFWKEGIKAVKEYIKEKKEKYPDEIYYVEEMCQKFNYQEKDLNVAFNMAYDFAMDMHNYSYKKDTEELRQKLAEKYITLIDGTVNPGLINTWWDFAKTEKVIKKAIFVADKNCLYNFGPTILRGRLYFKYDNLERKPSESYYYEEYLGNEIYVEDLKVHFVEEGKWYYKDMDVLVSQDSYRYYGYKKDGRTYYFNMASWDKDISNFKEVSKNVEKELEKYVEGK